MRKGKGMFYFTLLLLEPKQDKEKISREKISIDELKQFSKYLEEQTTKGIPVKARISIYEEETKKGSIALSTNRDGTDVLEILLARVSQPEILRYLAENRGKQSSSPASFEAGEVQEEEPEQSVKEFQEVSRTKEQIESEEEQYELPVQNTRKDVKKSTKKLSKQLQTSRPSTEEWKNKFILILAGLVVLLFLLNGFLFLRQSTLANKLEVWQTKAEKAVTLVEKQPKIDTTSRFFLASYFSQAKEAPYKEGLKKFVGTSVEKWERPSGELNSMFLYEINEEKKGTEVNYILTISEEKTTKIKKISFYMKEKDGIILVVSQPKLEDFSW